MFKYLMLLGLVGCSPTSASLEKCECFTNHGTIGDVAISYTYRVEAMDDYGRKCFSQSDPTTSYWYGDLRCSYMPGILFKFKKVACAGKQFRKDSYPEYVRFITCDK
jgi:hypothetical protein